MPTFGEVRIALLKTPHVAGADLSLLTQRINSRYFEVLNHFPWTRLHRQSLLAVVAKYVEGTVDVTNGSTAISGTGTTWTSAMTGRRIRIGSRNEWYTFTFVSTTSGTLDRAYEGETATDLAYRIWQPIYALPSDLDILESISDPEDQADLNQKEPEELDQIDPSRLQYGDPLTWSRYQDNSASPSLPQIELWPGPEDAEGLQIRYRTAGSRFTLSGTSTQFPTWIDTDAIIYGVEADFLTDAGRISEAQAREAQFRAKLKQMVQEDCERQAPIQMQLTDRFTEHRQARAAGDDRFNRRAQLLRSIP